MAQIHEVWRRYRPDGSYRWPRDDAPREEAHGD